MKRISLIIFTLECLSLGVYANGFLSNSGGRPLSKARIGLSSGVGINRLNYGSEVSKVSLGFNLGPVINIPLSQRLTLELGATGSKKGGTIDYVVNNLYSGMVNYNLYYLDFPMLVKIKPGRALTLIAGYQPGAMLDAHIEYLSPYTYGFIELNEDYLTTWNHALVAGFTLGNKKREFGLKCIYGLNEIPDNDYADSFLEGARNATLQISFTRYFGPRPQHR